ncbi:MAG TPA: acetate--CoA ligase family protein, partial [Candidatus Brocadiia bacterium]|nr:acetate--CoA ligase family protein [Candidatus Brocadiia bacterium]
MLDHFFEPKAVAVVGASREPGKVGYSIVKNLVDYGFGDKTYPINPKADQILGVKCFPTLKSVPTQLDMAIIVVPAKFVMAVMEDCAAAKVDAVIIITAGFKESGHEGAALERQVKEFCAKHGIRIIGPNCLGLINTAQKLNASFAEGMPQPGNIAFISQSGAFGTAILDWAIAERIGFSKFISVGNKADVDETDLLEAIGSDTETRVVLAYLESIARGEAFMRAARAVTHKKPVIVMKSGGTAAGAKAASSHTGALAGSENAFNSAFRQTGIQRATAVQDLFDAALAFSFCRDIQGNRIALVTNAGGPGIIATDAIERSELRMAEFTKETTDKLRQSLPPTSNVFNPVDVIGDAKADRYKAALDIVITDPNVDGILIILTPQTSTEVKETAQVIIDTVKKTSKPIAAVFMGGAATAPGFRLLMDNRVPTYPFPERAIAALESMYRHYRWITRPVVAVETLPVNRAAVDKLFKECAANGVRELGEVMARQVVEAYGLRLPQSKLATTPEEAAALAEGMGWPIVLKISSPDILHKSDIGGVKVGLRDRESVIQAFRAMVENARRLKPGARVDGALVQQMITGGKEIILGMTRDPQFGPMVMFGL